VKRRIEKDIFGGGRARLAYPRQTQKRDPNIVRFELLDRRRDRDLNLGIHVKHNTSSDCEILPTSRYKTPTSNTRSEQVSSRRDHEIDRFARQQRLKILRAEANDRSCDSDAVFLGRYSDHR
jgi:hypothetical protein